MTIMNTRNQRFSTLIALALGILLVGACDQGLTGVNKNPNAPEEVPVNNLLLGGIWDVANNSANRGVFGQWTMLYHGENWTQHLAQPVYNDEDKYTPRAGIPGLIWDEMYFALTDLAEAKALAEEAGDDNVWAVAEIVTVYGFMVLTDYYDAIPYFEALRLNEEVSYPAYDDQSEIYPDLLARLTAAANRIDPDAVIDFGDFDPVYQGDLLGWRMFANSLRLRLAMRMVNVDPGAAKAAFEAAWASSIFTSLADQADVDWGPAYPSANPCYLAIVYGGRPGDFRMSESLINRLAAFNDPRLPIYAEPASSDGQYRGLRNGLLPGDYAPTTTSNDYSQIGTYFLTPTTPSNLLSYAEVLFLGAEAAERGWNVGGPAATLYEDGITAAMEELGIGASDIATYLGQESVGYTTGIYQRLDAIHVQKWISLFLAGPEAFSDLRRIGWDFTTDPGTTGADLVPAENSAIGQQFPSGLTYPEDEILLNPANYPGDRQVTDPVWWMGG
jgi:hypothetical protein